MDFLIIILFGFALIWLFIVLPQRRRQSTHQKMLASLAPGDEVLTSGGIYGYVTEIAQEEVALEVADGVEIRVAKRAVAALMPPDDEDEEEEDEEEPAEESEEGRTDEPPEAAERGPIEQPRG